MGLGLGPDEEGSILVIGFDEGVDVLRETLDREEGRVVHGLSLRDREPYLHLIESGGPHWREVEMHVGMAPV